MADLSTFTESTWIFERHCIARLMGAPGAHASELYRDRSPIAHAANVEEPLLILQGEEDIVCHPSQMNPQAAPRDARAISRRRPRRMILVFSEGTVGRPS